MKNYYKIAICLFMVFAIIGCKKSNDSNYYLGGSSVTPTCPTGAINGLYSVSANKQVYFSQGNLQYKASAKTWRFADNQYDFVGGDNYYNGVFVGNVQGSSNNSISPYYSGWIDLFGWGTSGYNNKYPYMTSSDSLNYGDGFNDICYTNYDWGVYNRISNGGNQANKWRTLSKKEWRYVLFSRNTVSNVRFTLSRVNGVNGLLLLPDDWDTSVYNLNNINCYNGANYADNTISYNGWHGILEPRGAIFLPAAGFRHNGPVSIHIDNNWGAYWSASHNDDEEDDGSTAWHITMVTMMNTGLTHIGGTDDNRSSGFAVRLVQDYQ